jgi:hypothetical protein
VTCAGRRTKRLEPSPRSVLLLPIHAGRRSRPTWVHAGEKNRKKDAVWENRRGGGLPWQRRPGEPLIPRGDEEELDNVRQGGSSLRVRFAWPLFTFGEVKWDLLAERKPLALEYVAAFFDGEGSICLSPGMYSIGVSLRFSQVDKRILDEIAEFLRSRGVSGIGVYVGERSRRNSIHTLSIGSNDGAELALAIMAPYLRVKSVQAKLTLDYLGDRITGDQFIEAMNVEVRAGRRAGKIFTINQPFKRSEGIRKIWNASLAHARQIFRDMAITPDGHRRFGLNAIERNTARGVETKKRILRLLCQGSKNTEEIWLESGRSMRQVRRHLKELETNGYLRRERKSMCEPHVHTITENGRRYASE